MLTIAKPNSIVANASLELIISLIFYPSLMLLKYSVSNFSMIFATLVFSLIACIFAFSRMSWSIVVVNYTFDIEITPLI